MTKVRDSKGGRLGGNNRLKDKSKKDPPKEPLQITLANAPVLHAKFAEDIAIHLREVAIEMKKMNLMLGDVVKKLRDDG
jgi:hypothetical protein